MKILIIGGYGVFGRLLAKRLLRESIGEVIVAGRTLENATAFCAEFGGQPILVDRNSPSDLANKFEIYSPDIVVDAAGPFDYAEGGYLVALAAIKARAHYIDLADDADFVSNIGVLNDKAKHANCSAISGVSSVPAISTAALDTLTKDMLSVKSIDMAILPGNRAPRGLAVIQSILGQAGTPFKVWADGDWKEQTCWGDLVSSDLIVSDYQPIYGRWSSSIRVPDTILLADRYGTETITFRAGLELKLLHGGLWLMAFLPRLNLVKSLRPLSRLVQIIAGWFEYIGSDRGGMFVEVEGTDQAGHEIKKRWTLIAEEGAGPNVPATPAYVLIKNIMAGKVEAGARPALGEIALGETEEALSAFAIYCETKTTRV